MATELTGEAARLCDEVADWIAELVARGTFRPGERLPSVRKLARERGVSVSTAVEAYRLLQRRGLAKARPQSGFFVSPALAFAAPSPSPSRPLADPARVANGELIAVLLGDALDPGLAPLGAALPDPELIPAEALNRALGRIARTRRARIHAYEMPPGCRELRVQVAKRASESGTALGPEEVLTTAGGQEALTVSLLALLKPGDCVAVESPAYYGALQALEALGLRALEVASDPGEGIQVPALAKALARGCVKACLLAPSFHNPTGSLAPDAAKKEIARLLAKHDVPLIEDDTYGDLAFSGERPRTIQSYDRKGLVLLASSVSKTLSPGLRVGWVAAARKHRDRLERAKTVTTIAGATLPQLVVADYLASGAYDRHVKRIAPIHERRLAELRQAVLRHFPRGTRTTCPRGGFVLWVEVPGSDSVATLARARREGITFAPGPLFSAQEGFRSFLRLNGAVFRPELEPAIARLGAILATRRAPLPPPRGPR